MELILQTNVGLNPEVQKFGCRFRSLLAIAEFHTQKALKVSQIETAYKELVDVAMDVHCTCNSREDKIIRWGMRELFCTARGYQIGIAYGCERIEFWPAAQIYTILKGLTHRKGEDGRTEDSFHFRLGDRMGKLLFDPMPAAVVKEEQELLTYQVLT
jgi:hypothetical protein